MTRKSKPRRACKMCKWYKYVGNSKRADARDPQRVRADDSYRDQLHQL